MEGCSIRWGLGSTAVRISEEYIYGQPQHRRLAHFIELMEMLNPHSRPKLTICLPFLATLLHYSFLNVTPQTRELAGVRARKVASIILHWEAHRPDPSAASYTSSRWQCTPNDI